VVKPFLLGSDGTTNLGPGGLSTNGWNIGDHGQVTKSFALNLCASGTATGINLTAGDSGTVGDKIAFSSSCTTPTGVLSTGSNNHIMGMNVKGITGAGIGVSITGANSVLDSSYIEGNAATGSGISVAGSNTSVIGNTVASNPIDTMATGIVLGAVAT